MKILNILSILGSLMFLSCSNDSSQVQENPSIDPPIQGEKINFYKGTTMGFTTHLETFGNVEYKENGEAKDPYKSIADHGANMVRFRIDYPPFSSSYSSGYPNPDFRSVENVKLDMKRAKDNNLTTLLTFGYKSHALEDNQKLNDYVAPLTWQPIANDIEKLKDSVYNHTYKTLKDYISSGLIPTIVSIGNETNGRLLEPNVKEEELPPYSANRTVALLNSGTKAVRDINSDYSLNIKVAIHLFDASKLQWWLEKHNSLGLDFDILALSHYHGWHSLGTFSNWKSVIRWVKNTYKKDFLIIETAQLFTTNGNDSHVNILGPDINIPEGYTNPPTTQTQRAYLKDFAQEIYDGGGLGLLVWGGEWVGADCLIYADKWGAGSSWENKAFWDFNHNLHDGVNWMKDVITD